MPLISTTSPSARRRALLALVVIAALTAMALALWPRDEARRPSAGESASTAQPSDPGSLRASTRLGGLVITDPERVPLAGVVVAIVAEGHSAVARTVMTGPDGRFEAELGAGRHSLRAASNGRVQAAPLVVDLGGAPIGDVVLRMRAATDGVAGVVVDAESGPIAGAEVHARPLGALRSAAAVALTDDRGRYALTLADGGYEIVARHDSYVEERRLVSVRGGVRRADFRLFPAGAIEGTVVRARDHTPVQGACVRLELADGSAGLFPASDLACAMTGVDGQFEITGVAPGQVALTASALGLGTWTAHQVTIRIGETVTGVELMLDDAHELRGEVRSRRGDAPLVGVAVVALRPEDQGRLAARAITGAAGEFTLVGLAPGRYIVRNEPGAGALMSAVASVDVPSDSPLVLLVDAGVTVSGHVVPAAAGRVTLRARIGEVGLDQLGSAMAAEAIAATEIGKDGAFVLGGVPAGTWDVHADTGDDTGATTIVVADQDVSDVTVALGKRASLCGWVRDDRGVAVDDVTVTNLPRQQPRSSLPTTAFRQARHELGTEQVPVAEDGAFCLTDLEPGEHHIIARTAQDSMDWGPRHLDQGNLVAVTLGAGERRTGWVLEVVRPSAVLAGTVTDPAGQPVADALVRIAGRSNPNEEGAAFPSVNAFAPPPPVVTDDAGRFRFEALRQGRYSVTADHPGTGSSGGAADVATGDAVVITLEASGELHGRLAAEGSGSCRVRLHGPTSQSVAAAGSDCAFSFDGLRSGRYTIEVTRGPAIGYASAEVVAGRPASVVVSLASLASVRARFVDGSGQPVPDVVLLVVSDPAAMESLVLELISGTLPRSDAEGRITASATTGKAVAVAVTADGQRFLHRQDVEVPAAGLDLGDVEVKP